MKKKTIEQRINNSINVFFDESQNFGENKLSYVNNVALAKDESKTTFTEKADGFGKILKTVFIFLPGAFFLYFISIFFLYAFFIDKTNLLNFGFGLMFWVVSALMTMFGIGDIKKLRSLWIPASVCAVSFAPFVISLFLPSSMQTKFLFEYAAYFFPLVLIVSYLTKTLIDKADNKNSAIEQR